MSDPVETTQEGESKDVTLKAEQYDALLDRLAELEALAVKKAAKAEEEDEVDLDKLVSEAKHGGKQQEPQPQQVDLDSMSNTQLFQFIMQQGDAIVKDVRVGLETLKLMREIDKAEAQHEDFWQYEGDIRKICTANPTLTVEQAYRLATSNKPSKTDESSKEGEDKKTSERRTRSEKILNLPPRQSGEKPGPAQASTKAGDHTITAKEAADRAWDEVVGKGKTEL